MLNRLQTVLSTLRNRHERQLAIRALSMMNDRQLADIGVARGSVVDAVDGRLQLAEGHASSYR